MVVVQGVYSGNEGKVVAVNPSLNRLQVRLPLFNSEKPTEFIPEQLQVVPVFSSVHACMRKRTLA